MSADASSSLPLDIERALQQAVGDANNAANLTKKKKSKRARDDDHTHSGDAASSSAKKRKTRATRETSTGDTSVIQVGDATADSGVIEASSSESSTKTKKKGKGKEREKEQEKDKEKAIQQDDQPIAPPSEDVTSSADFLSAVVAAASATAGHPPPPGHAPYDHSMPPFLDYPQDFVPYPYPPPGPSGSFPHPQQPMYPDPSGVIPDLGFASSEDLLRTLQELDLAKVMNVLRSLGEAATAANVSVTGQPVFMPHPPPQGPPPINQQPARSDAIVGHPPKQKRPAHAAAQPSQAGLSPPPPVQHAHNNSDHAHMLANVWMNAAKLAEMVKKEGLVYKKGKFSAIEEAQLNAAIDHYCVTKGITAEQLSEIIFSKERGRDSFWPEITSALHLRPIIAVYHHVRRTRHPLSQQGKWMPSEDDLLVQAVSEFGQQWEKVSFKVGRMSSDCRDRWRNHLQDRGTRQSGPWSKEEEEELTQIVTEMTVEKGKDIDNDIFWGVVSRRMGGKRGRQQCRIKWTDTLSTQIKNAGERPRWSQMDAFILVHKVDSLNVRDDSEIDWKSLPDEHWNIWSAHSLQRRWVTMKRGIKGYEEMSHAEIMEILKTKKAQALPIQTSTRKKKSKVTSAEAVLEDQDGDEQQPEAGSSAVHISV